MLMRSRVFHRTIIFLTASVLGASPSTHLLGTMLESVVQRWCAPTERVNTAPVDIHHRHEFVPAGTGDRPMRRVVPISARVTGRRRQVWLAPADYTVFEPISHIGLAACEGIAEPTQTWSSSPCAGRA